MINGGMQLGGGQGGCSPERDQTDTPAYIALTTTPEGPAVTVDQNVELSRQIFGKTVNQHSLRAEQLTFDINAFPIGAEPEPGLNFAHESINAIPRIKQLPRMSARLSAWAT